MIYDCFTYFNEVDALKIRLEELSYAIDCFVIVEATQTFTGHSKPLYFDTLPSWIERWRDKIIRVVIDFPEDNMSAWDRETYQRNQIIRGLDSASYEDIIIISDADEIPRMSVLADPIRPYRLDVVQYFWNLNWQVPQHCNQGARPVVAKYAHLLKTTPQELRAGDDTALIPHAGWHFSFLGAGLNATEKIEAFAHTEVNKEDYKTAEHINRCIHEGIDPFDRFPLKYTAIGSTHPGWVQRNQDELRHLIM